MQTFFQNIDLTIWQWVLLSICCMLIGMSKTGLSGVGLAVVPLMASIFGGKPSVGVLLPILIFADIFAVSYYHQHATWKYVLRLLPWALVGIVVGTYFGNSINDNQFKSSIAILVLIGITLMIWQDIRKKRSVPDNWWFAALLGLAGGFTTMVGNAAGPVMALYLLSMRLPKNEFIGTAAWFFFIINIIKVPFHIFSWETITLQSFTLNLICLPAIIIGAVLGVKLVKLFPERAYRFFVIISTLIAAIFLL